MMNFEKEPNNQKFFKSDMIYHYTSLNTAMEWILPSRRLRFSSFMNVNDPFEKVTRSIGYWFKGIDTSDNDRVLEYKNYDLANSIRLNDSKLLCFSQNDEKIKFSGSTYIDRNKYYRTGFFKPRMWAQYGGNNRGVCLAISRDELAKEIKNTYSDFTMYRSQVNYSDAIDENREAHKIRINPSEIIDFRKYYIEEHIKNNRQQLFFNKNSDWKDEKEYRYLIITEGKDNDYYVDISNCIRGVFCGIEFPDVYMESLKSLTKYLEVDVFKLYINDGMPSVKISV